jgi:hypothetical protein
MISFSVFTASLGAEGRKLFFINLRVCSSLKETFRQVYRREYYRSSQDEQTGYPALASEYASESSLILTRPRFMTTLSFPFFFFHITKPGKEPNEMTLREIFELVVTPPYVRDVPLQARDLIKGSHPVPAAVRVMAACSPRACRLQPRHCSRHHHHQHRPPASCSSSTGGSEDRRQLSIFEARFGVTLLLI